MSNEGLEPPIIFKATATIGTMTDSDPHANSRNAESSTQTISGSIVSQSEQSTMTEPLMSQSEQSTMTDPSISQSEQSTMTRPLTLKDLFHPVSTDTLPDSSKFEYDIFKDQVIIPGDDSEPEERVTSSLQHNFNIFNIFIILTSFFTFLNICFNQNFELRDQSAYVYFPDHEL